MAIYYKLGCARCKVQAAFLRSGSSGMGWLHSAAENIPEFAEAHEDHPQDLCVYTESDPRYKAYADWEPPREPGS